MPATLYKPYGTIDAKPVVIKTTKPESPFQKSRRIQERYARVLRGIAKEVGKLIQGYAPKDIISVEKLRNALRSYSEIIGPWSLTVIKDVFNEVDRQDKWAWNQHSRDMSAALRKELMEAPTGEVFSQMMREQVNLIKSIPLEAGQRVHNLVTENLMHSARADEIAKKILQTENITKNRATLIARTEIARASSKLVEARATHVGSEGYIWRTSKDLLVRKSHQEMNGKFCKWDSPPVLSDKTTTHPGQIYNCRCWPDPIIGDDDI